MEYIIIGIVVLVFIGLIFVLVPYLKRKNYISEVGMGVINSIIGQVKIMISNAKFPDSELLNKAQLVTNIALIASKSVERSLKFEKNSDKRNVAIAGIEATLLELNVPLEKDRKAILGFAVDQAVNLLPPTHNKFQ